MTAADILEQLRQSGVRLKADGGRLIVRPASLLTDETRALLREHKPELIRLLRPDSIAERRERRRWKVLDMLAEAPETARYAYLADTDSHPEYVIVALAIRGVGSCELSVLRERWDPFRFLELVEQMQ